VWIRRQGATHSHSDAYRAGNSRTWCGPNLQEEKKHGDIKVLVENFEVLKVPRIIEASEATAPEEKEWGR
jgi:hypothetical protein